MGTYQVTTDNGTYNVQTDDGQTPAQAQTNPLNPVAQAYQQSQQYQYPYPIPQGAGMNSFQGMQVAAGANPEAYVAAIKQNVLNPLEAQGAGMKKQAEIAPDITEKTQELQAENEVGAARQVAEENTNLDIFTNALREASKNIGRAAIQNMAGGTLQNFYGNLVQHGLLPGNESGQKAYAAYDSLKSTMIPQLNSIYSTQYGGRDPSTRIMSSLLELGAKELPGMDKTIPADEGQIKTSLYRFVNSMQGSLSYIKNNYTAQQLLDAYKKDPKILDKYAEQAFNNSQSYKMSAQTIQGLNDRYDQVIQPLEAAKKGMAVYDIPQKDGSVKTYMVPSKEAAGFEKRNKL